MAKTAVIEMPKQQCLNNHRYLCPINPSGQLQRELENQAPSKLLLHHPLSVSPSLWLKMANTTPTSQPGRGNKEMHRVPILLRAQSRRIAVTSAHIPVDRS